MKRTLTSIITFVLLGFLFIGGIGVFQNIVQDISKTFNHGNNRTHILAYHIV